ncbi:MAG: penicillin acylase family protein [Rhodobacteraceae bacterium]|nr:penicillin acylase family protein [Paracoccaceae bacterium]
MARLAAVFAAVATASCSVVAPLPKARNVPERLQDFPTTDLPVERPVTIYWSDEQIPYIEAETDGDAAFSLGLVHAHLRLGQMATARMLAQGRVSEMIGPVGVNIDHGLRTVSYGRAAESIERDMDEPTRQWVQRFVDGINHYQDTTKRLPHEFRILGLQPERWEISDVVAIGRLAGSDVNWLAWAEALPLRNRSDWPEMWAKMVAKGSSSIPSFESDLELELAQRWLGGMSRSGSNSLAVAPQRTSTGGALIANDPHLGIMIPGVWLLAGVKSPSYNVVGMMGPAIPIFAIGRNEHIGWGGTNMRVAASDLYDISRLPDEEYSSERHRIAVRWWRDKQVDVRSTRFGPVVTDIPFIAEWQLPPLALKWAGHDSSDEIGAMLAVSRARDFEQFRTALDRFSVPGQNMIYADADGNIGQVMATHVPIRTSLPDDIIANPDSYEETWQRTLSATELPYSYNPDKGFLVSANNRPTDAGPHVSFLFTPDDRVLRMTELITSNTPVDVNALRDLQRDVYMHSSDELRRYFVSALDDFGIAGSTDSSEAVVVERLRNWNGEYSEDSVGAVAFEQFRHGFTTKFAALRFGEGDGQAMARRVSEMLDEDFEAADRQVLQMSLRAGLETAVRQLDVYKGWGEMHRLVLAHPLYRVPAIGGRYRFEEAGVRGSSQTIMKMAHESSPDRHEVAYGSNARHISDMTDPDANYFVLLGGQDGWFNSSTLIDQWDLWKRGEYVQLPLRPSTVRRRFPHRMTLTN